MRRNLTEFDHLSPAAGEFVFEALDLGMRYAEEEDGFLPFATVLEGDGSPTFWRLVDDEHNPTTEGALAVGRAELRGVDPSTRCVTLVWDGYLTLGADRTDAVFVEGYELGQPVGVLLAQRYERTVNGLDLVGNPVLLSQQPEPLVP